MMRRANDGDATFGQCPHHGRSTLRGMTVQFWTLIRKNVDPSPPSGAQPFSVEGRVTLDYALAVDPDPDAWVYEAHDKPVATLAEFRRLADSPGETKTGAFVASAPGFEVKSESS